MTSVVFHVPKAWLGPEGKGMLRFYEALIDGMTAQGWDCEMRAIDRDRLRASVDADSALHIINHGRFNHPRALNAGIAYVYPFWNVDPEGIRAFSSIRDMAFRPATIDADFARPFFRKLRGRLVGKRKSRYAQPQEPTLVPKGSVAVFLQAEGFRDVAESCYLDRTQMVETVLGATRSPVVVKPHPEDKDPRTRAWLWALTQKFAHLHVSDANIHDIIAVADRVVTINSAVGIEAYLHRKPVILCGQSDFHHIADVARTTEDLANLLDQTPSARAYDKFIYWYFGKMCLSATDEDLALKVIARLQSQHAQGAPR